jgi:hypothetical protein
MDNGPSESQQLNLKDLEPQGHAADTRGLYAADQIAKPFDPHKQKSVTATAVAMAILSVFALSILGTLAMNFWVLEKLIVKDPKVAEEFVTKVAVPLLTSVGTFGATLFGPLLAFVLGFYFGESKQRSPA